MLAGAPGRTIRPLGASSCRFLHPNFGEDPFYEVE